MSNSETILPPGVEGPAPNPIHTSTTSPLAVPGGPPTSATALTTTDLLASSTTTAPVSSPITSDQPSQFPQTSTSRARTELQDVGDPTSTFTTAEETTTQSIPSEVVQSTTAHSSVLRITTRETERTSTTPTSTSSTSTQNRSTLRPTSSRTFTRLTESSTASPTSSTSSGVPPVPPPVPLFTSTTSSTSEITSTSTWSDSSSSSTWESTESLPSSAPIVGNLQVDSSSMSATTTESSTTTMPTSTTESPSSNTPTSTPEITGSDTNSNNIASTDSATSSKAGIGADSAQSNLNPDTKSDGSSKLSSIAIVGIVGGVLVGLIALFLAWYQWRKKRAREALMDINDDGMDEKFSPDIYQNRITRSSFGAADPITPYVYRQKNNHSDEEDFWYDPNDMQRVREHDERIRQNEQQYNINQNPNPFEDNLFDPTKTTLPPSDVRTNYTNDYDLDVAASLAEDNSPELLHRSNSDRSEIVNANQNPFVPPIPTNSYGGLNRNLTVRTIPAVPDDVDDASVYESYSSSTTNNKPNSIKSRPQSEYTEPPTSNLLPWINKGLNPQQQQQRQQQQDNPPAVPNVPAQIARNVSTKNIVQQLETDNTNSNEPIRQPPRAMMNQIPNSEIPKGHGGELAEIPIPTFR